MTNPRSFAKLFALAVALISVAASAMPPSRMGPTWGNHNRAVHEARFVHALVPTPTESLIPIISNDARVAPLPAAKKLLDEVVSPSAPDRMRVVVDVQSSAPGVYVTSGLTTRVTPVTVKGTPRPDALNNEFIARATYADLRLHPHDRPPERLILDYDAGQLAIERNGSILTTTPATLPDFHHVLNEPRANENAVAAD